MLDWRERRDGPAPAGLVAGGASTRALLAELRRRGAGNPDSLDGLTLAATRDLLVVLGPAERLPWVDGVAYCAPLPDLPGLWLPTRLAPALPPELLHAGLQRRTGHAAVLLWHAPELAIGLDARAPLRPAVLDWVEGELA